MSEPLKTRREREKQARYDTILDAAELVFSEKGYERTSMDDIAHASRSFSACARGRRGSRDSDDTRTSKHAPGALDCPWRHGVGPQDPMMPRSLDQRSTTVTPDRSPS